MIHVNTNVDIINVALFTKSHANVLMTFMLEIIKLHFKITEEHFQDVSQKVIKDNHLEYFSDQFFKQFTQKPIPQQCCDIISFQILILLNPIDLMELWGKLSCTPCIKQRIEIVNHLICSYILFINSCLEVYRSYHHIPIFHRFTWN